MTEDDGSLGFLNLPPDENLRRFNCKETSQQKLINKTFWVLDFFDNVKTKYGPNRFLVHIKFNIDDDESETRKFFTNSQEIKYVLQKIKDMNKFPRKVTMMVSGTRYYFE